MNTSCRALLAAVALGSITCLNADAATRVCSFYLESFTAFQKQLALGLDIREAGLLLHTRLTPKLGSDVASIIVSAKPVSTKELAFVESNSLFSFAMGSASIPPTLKKQFIDLYSGIVASAPNFKDAETNDMAIIMEHSMRMFGSPMAFTGTLSTNGMALFSQGVLTVPDPSSYLNDQLALMKTPGYQRMMGQSGMTLSDVGTRAYKGVAVYTWKSSFDEKVWAKRMGGIASNTPPEQADTMAQAQLGPMRAMMSFFSNGYEYAAMQKELAFGMGSPAMVEQAVDRIRMATGPSSESLRIRNALGLLSAPHTIGRFSLSDLFRLGRFMLPASASFPTAQPVPSGEGVVFANWIADGEARSALLVPSSEIKAVTAQVQAIKGSAHPNAVPQTPPAHSEKND